MINFTQLPEWMDLNIWMDKIMLSGLEGTYSMVVDKEGYITDTRILTDYEGNNLPEGTLWLPTGQFRTQFRHHWEDFCMELYVSNKLPDKIATATRSELANIIKLANSLVLPTPPDDLIDGMDHPYLYHYKLNKYWEIKELSVNITVSIYHIYDEKDDKVKIIFNVTDIHHAMRLPEWNPKAKIPFSVLFG